MIRLEQVSKTYHLGEQRIAAVDRISLHVKPGDFAALRGPSGSGKSTLMHIVGCLDCFDSGRYFLEDTDVSHMKEQELAEIRNQKIGFVHQSFNLLPRLTALENVELPLIYAGVKGKERIERARELLNAVGLSEREKHFPIQMSGGEQQRVAIARALVNRAPLLLADEPTGNLDSKTSIEILSILARLNERGTTIVMVTHEQDVAEWANYSVYVRDGKLET